MIVEWVVRKYLPINFFEDDIEQEFFQYLNSNAKMPKRNHLRSLIEKTFKYLRITLRKFPFRWMVGRL